MTDDSGVLDILERWSSTLFLTSGTILIGFAASMAAIGLLNMSVPRNLFAGAGFTLAFLGLLGLSPRLADRSPRLARAGAVFAVLGMIGFSVTFVITLLELIEMSLPAWVETIQLLNLIGIVFGFLLSGSASLRSETHARSLGLLLLVPGLVFAVNFIRVGAMGAWTPSWAPFVLGSLQALAMLAIGYSLRAESISPGPTTRTADRAA